MAAAPASALSPASAEKPRPAETGESDESRWQPVLGLPCRLTVDLRLPNFKVADLLRLQPGKVMATRWRVSRDLPLRINGVLIGWGEFEGSGNHLAVRVTELA